MRGRAINWRAALSARTIILFAAVSSSAPASDRHPLTEHPVVPTHPECPGDGSCCAGHGAPGCSNSTCCNIVCEFDYFCCIGWDLECARWAEQLCPSVCAGACPADGDCCADHDGGGCRGVVCCDLICRDMPSCCEAGWTASCAAVANQVCDECKEDMPFTCPHPGDCCSGRYFTGGCDRWGCCEIVCLRDDFCCHTAWDPICAELAQAHCPNVCDCEEFGNFDEASTIDLRDVAAFLNCHTGIGSTITSFGCACADFDGDDDGDLQDYRVLANLLDQTPD